MTWLVVDAMNVIGSRPDGWWRDRRGAIADLVAAIRTSATGLGADRITVVADGRGTDEPVGPDGVELCWAGTGRDAADDRIVELLADAVGPATVVTADRRLRDRAIGLGADVTGPRSFLQGVQAAGP